MEAQKRRKTGGRRKGTPNKVTATTRENILAVFTRLGGADGKLYAHGTTTCLVMRL